jgi:hypothetical protein
MHVDGHGLGPLREERGVQPGRADGPDDVAPEDDDGEADEVGAEHLQADQYIVDAVHGRPHDAEGRPLVVRVCLRRARDPVPAKRDADSEVSAYRESRRARTHKRACPNRSMNGRMKKRRRGAWMSAVSSGRCVVGGCAITRAYKT